MRSQVKLQLKNMQKYEGEINKNEEIKFRRITP